MDFEDDKTEYLNDDPQQSIISKVTDEKELDAMEAQIKADLEKAEGSEKVEGIEKSETVDTKTETSEKIESKGTETEPEKKPEKSETSDTSKDDNLIRPPAKEGEFVVDEEFINKQPEENRELFKLVLGKSKADLAKAAANAIAMKNPYIKDNEKAIDGIAEKILEGTDEEIYTTFIDTKRVAGSADPPPEKKIEEIEVKDEIPKELPELEDTEAIQKIVNSELLKQLKAKYPEMPDDIDSLEYREWKRDMVSDDDEKAAEFNQDKVSFTGEIKGSLQKFAYLSKNHTEINNLRYNKEVKAITKQLDSLGLTVKDLEMDLELKPDNNGLLYNEELNTLMRDSKGLDPYVINKVGDIPFLINETDKNGMTPLTKKFFFENNLKIMALVANRNVLKDETEIERLREGNLNTLHKQSTGDASRPVLLTEEQIAKINDEDVIDKKMRELENITD